MTPHAYALHISTAHGYVHYITNDNPHTLAWWAQAYGVDDIKKWAERHIFILLEKASALRAALGGAVEHSADTDGYVVALRELGFRVD